MISWAPLPALLGVAAVGFQMLRMQRSRSRASLLVTISHTASTDDELTFTVTVAQTGSGPAQGVAVRAAVGPEVVAEVGPFDVPADQNHSVPVAVPRPRLGTIVAECGNQPTLYGEPLVATARDARGATASAEWRELPLVREADPARYEAMHRAWAAAGKARKSF